MLHEAIAPRHPAEAELLGHVAAGDPAAAAQVLGQLGSGNPWLRQIIVETIQDSADPQMWRQLLAWFARHQWRADILARSGPAHETPEVSRRVDDSISELFVTDAGPADPVKVALLRDALHDDIPRMRHAAACLLGQRGEHHPRVVDMLIETVRSGELICRLRAMQTLAKLQEPRGADVLVEALATDTDEQIHWAAAHALVEIGPAAVPALLEAARAPRTHLRWHAVRALGQIGDVYAAPGVAAALTDEDYGVRWAAADVLGHMGARAVPAILGVLSAGPPRAGVREAAYHALHQMAPEIQERLTPVLDALRGPGAADATPMAAFRLRQTWPGG